MYTPLYQKMLTLLLIAVVIPGCVVGPQVRVSSHVLDGGTVKLNPSEPVLVAPSVSLISNYRKIQNDGAGLLLSLDIDRPINEFADYLRVKGFTVSTFNVERSDSAGISDTINQLQALTEKMDGNNQIVQIGTLVMMYRSGEVSSGLLDCEITTKANNVSSTWRGTFDISSAPINSATYKSVFDHLWSQIGKTANYETKLVRANSN